MAWLEGSVEYEKVIEAPGEEVKGFFGDPSVFTQCVEDVEELEELADGRWRFTLEEMSAKGISFQGEYTVRYHHGDDRVWWDPAGDESDNMKADGAIRIEERADDRTKIYYDETMSVDLPIPSLMTRVFNPIVSRLVKKGVESMVDCAKAKLEAGGE